MRPDVHDNTQGVVLFLHSADSNHPFSFWGLPHKTF